MKELEKKALLVAKKTDIGTIIIITITIIIITIITTIIRNSK
jgi:hypothetical protein